MDVSTLLTMTQTVLQLLDSSVMKEIENIWSFRSQLKKMKDTMSTIKAVLHDAEEQEKHQVQRSEADNDWLEKLREVVYEADDLFDKLATLAQREKLVDGVIRKVYLLLSHPTFIFSASREIKEIREKLDAIAKDRRDFGSHVLRQHHPIEVGEGSVVKKTREESHSFVCDEDVVGRNDDKEALIDMLLDPSVEENVSCITIVGIGGLGKTTLAKLAYNNERIQGEFELRLWVCVSQNFYKIIPRIVELLKDTRCDHLRLEQLQVKLQQEIKGKRYLPVLDDLWNEDREEWLKLRELLNVGVKGSRILVTTRSHMVAEVIGGGRRYELEGLSLKDSWSLFEKMAFKEGEGHADVELIEIGKEIVRRCANIPLVLRIISSLLYGQGKTKWRSFRDIDLIHFKQDGVLPVLKLSYYHLASPLKSCFNYCALFPTDYEIEKKTLIRLWIAQGFIVPSYGQSEEETGEAYFMTLLHNGFFQEGKQDSHGELVSCTIPQVMHNLAQEAAKVEISVANSSTSQLNRKLRHLSVEHDFPYEALLSQGIATCPVKNIRTFFQLHSGGGLKSSISKNLVSKGICLRVLDLHGSNIKSLPTLDNLFHLRYLDLSSMCLLQALPDSLTKLHNLQTLKLNKCIRLKELPRGLRNLVNLEQLEISGCSLTHMPPGISNLTSLHSLTTFVVAQTSLYKRVHGGVGDLNDLKALINLKGSLQIIVQKISPGTAKFETANYLKSMKHLTDIHLDWRDSEDIDGNQEALLKGFQPHYNLQYFLLDGYPGVRFPSWDLFESSGAPLSNLVKISLVCCGWLQHLPLMCRLPYLKTLQLARLTNLEYIENNDTDYTGLASSHSRSTPDESSFFPSLEILELRDLLKLKGWWGSSGQKQQQGFPRLLSLEVQNCPILTSIPLYQNVEDLTLIEFNEALGPFDIKNKKVVADPSSSFSSTPMLKTLMIDNVEYLNSWPVESLQQLYYMEIHNSKLQSLSTVEKVFRCGLTSLVCLDIFCCRQLRSLSGGGLEHLTALETLRFLSLKSMSFNKEDVMPWKSLGHSLRSLELIDLPKLVNLPKGMQYLTTLQSLKISQCSELKALPEWISGLSLRSLYISSCSLGLKARCQEPTGEDWPKVQHIPLVTVTS